MYCKRWLSREPIYGDGPDIPVIIRGQVERLAQEHFGLTYAAQIPRRLGQSASGEALSADKRMLRQLRHNAETSLNTWLKAGRGRGAFLVAPEPHDPQAARRWGAQLDTRAWIRLQIVELEDRRVEFVNGLFWDHQDQKGANFVAHALTAEIDGLERISSQDGRPRSERR